jgi:26S proteasome regulatory subunit N10
VSPTEDIGKILACFSKIKLGGHADFATTVQIAQLALKHRKNKNGGQRIVVFVGSPIQDGVEKMVKIGKQLKKNNVAVDVISLGEVEENQDKLNSFIEAVNSSDNSHLINVPPGIAPSDAILTSPLMQDSPFGGMAAGGSGMGGAAAGNFDEFGGIDPSMDPELAMAIRVSTEEARAQEEARAKSAMEESKTAAASSSSSAAASSSSMPAVQEEEDEDEATLIQRALELSMRESTDEEGASASSSAVAMAAVDDEDMEEDEALRRALELSMVEDASSSSATSSSAPTTAAASQLAGIDPEFLNALLGSNDVDMNDPLIQAALAQLAAPSADDKSNRKRKKDGEDDGKKDS